MSPTLTRSPAPLARAGPARRLIPAIAALVAVYVLLFQTLRMPQVVPRLSIVNPHDWRANVEVAGAGNAGWMPLLGVDRQGIRDLQQVYDHGTTWRFRFTYGNVDGGELRMTRAELAAANWRVQVPEQFAQRMRQAGIAPSARLQPAAP